MKHLLKALILFGVFYALSQTLTAQDHIYLRDCGVMKVKVLGADSAYIKYRPYKRVAEVPRLLPAVNVLGIHYADGRVTTAYGDVISLQQLDGMRYYAISRKHYRRCIPLLCIGSSMWAAGIGLLAYEADMQRRYGNDPRNYYRSPAGYIFGGLLMGGGLAPMSIGFTLLGKHFYYKKKAANSGVNLSFEPILLPITTAGGYAGGSIRVNF